MSPVIRIEEDGTRVYSNYTRYKPKAPGERKNAVRKPDDPEAFRFRGEWLWPLPLLDEDKRPEIPETRPDELAYDHMFYRQRCKCDVCRRPQARKWRKKWRKEWRAQMRTDES